MRSLKRFERAHPVLEEFSTISTNQFLPNQYHNIGNTPHRKQYKTVSVYFHPITKLKLSTKCLLKLPRALPPKKSRPWNNCRSHAVGRFDWRLRSTNWADRLECKLVKPHIVISSNCDRPVSRASSTEDFVTRYFTLQRTCLRFKHRCEN